MADERQQLLQTADFGREVQEFTESRIGRYLIQCAEIEIEAGLEVLTTADPDSAKDMRAGQNRVWLGNKFKSWLLEAVNAGIQSERILEDRESDHTREE